VDDPAGHLRDFQPNILHRTFDHWTSEEEQETDKQNSHRGFEHSQNVTVTSLSLFDFALFFDHVLPDISSAHLELHVTRP
jgi:hypothetical protein